MEEHVQKYHAYCEALFNQSDKDRAQWAPVVKWVLPEIVAASHLQENDRHAEQARVCSRAKTDLLNLASAMMSYVFPAGHRWFSFKSWSVPDFSGTGNNLEQDEADDWFARATDVAASEIERSNFYSEMNAVTIDRCATGTAAILAEMDAQEDVLKFTHIPAGTFAIAENASHEINTLVRRFNFTAQQMVEAFGYENCPPDVQQNFDKLDQRVAEEREIWHLVCPRTEVLLHSDTLLPEARPFLSVYIDAASGHLLQEGGYYEFPYTCTRFIRYGNQVYGVSPLMTIKDDIKDNMCLDDCIKLLAQRAAMPPLALPADIADDLDMRPNGRTIIPMQYINQAVPREIAPVGRVDFLMDAKAKTEEAIDSATYVSVLQTVSSQDRYMTATEVNVREAEKILTFTPTFTQLQVDFRVLFNRVFSLLLRAGKFDTENAPDSVKRVYDDGGEYVINPKIAFVGKMAQAMERVQNNSTRDCLAMHLQLANATQNPAILAIYDFEQMARMDAVNSGVPSRILKSPVEVKRMLNDLQQQQDAANAAALQAQGAAAARDNAQAYNLMQPQ